jgi:TPR repeat protein
VYNWGDYIAPGVIDRFEEETGIRVIYEMFETNEDMYTKIKNSNSSYDVIIPSDYMIERMIDEDMLAEIEFANITNYGEIDAEYSIGHLYHHGHGVVVDYGEAMKWYRKAASHGQADAELSMGVCYENGEGVEQNYSEAARWYRIAAEHGKVEAEYNLGRCYYLGHGVVQDVVEAERWYMKAAKHGHKEAQEYFKDRYDFVE